MNGDHKKNRKTRNHQPGDEAQRQRPGPAMAGQLTTAAGPKDRYAGQGDDAVVLAAGRWDAIESWVHARKLAAARELARRRPAAGSPRRLPGGLPSAWRTDLANEIACELAVTVHAAETLAWLAVTLETRLPLTAAALDQGILNPSKARLIADATAVLADDLARQAEALIASRWAGQTWSRIRDMITRAVINVDPDGAIKRREDAEREFARIRFFREHAGTCGLAGYGLPTDEALKANQSIVKRAREYRAWGIDGTMEELRVRAYLDLLTEHDARKTQPRTPVKKRGKAKTGTPHGDSHTSHGRSAGHGAGGRGADGDGRGGQAAGEDAPGQDQTAQDETAAQDQSAGMDEDAWNDLLDDDRDNHTEDGQDDDGGQDEDGSGDSGNGDDNGDGRDGDDGRDGGGNGPDGRGPAGPGAPDGPAGGDDGLAANVDLTIPLADLTGYAERAGHAGNLGAIDPGLARRLARQAAKNPATSFRIIITDPDGHATGFGQATRAPGTRKPGAAPPPSPSPGTGDLPDHPGTPLTRFTPADTAGADGGHDTWTLEIGGTTYRVRLHPIQTSGPCDHRYESAGYRPSPTLRRLIQVRNGECAMPGCARSARTCEWEHAVPWPTGPTCACNGGAHCKRDHLIKQDPRWNITQNPDGTRTWTTPAGLRYTKPLMEYPD